MEQKKETITISIEDYCIDFAEECVKSIEYRIEHDCLDAVENRLRQHGYIKERTCKPTIEHHGDLIKTTYPCCGYELKEYKYSPYPEVAFNYCPNCGAKVVE